MSAKVVIQAFRRMLWPGRLPAVLVIWCLDINQYLNKCHQIGDVVSFREVGELYRLAEMRCLTAFHQLARMGIVEIVFQDDMETLPVTQSLTGQRPPEFIKFRFIKRHELSEPK